MSDAPAERSYREYNGLPSLAFPRDGHGDALRLRPSHLQLMAATFDLILIWSLTLASAIFYHFVFLNDFLDNTGRVEFYVVTSFGLAVACSLVAGLRGHYMVRRMESAESSAIAAFQLFNIMFAIFVCVLFMSKMTDVYSRASLGLQYAVTMGGLVVGRVVLAHIVRAAVQRGRIEARRIA